MDVLSKMILTLPEKQYAILLERVGGTKNHKNYITLECVRQGVDLEKINTVLGLNKSAYTIHKSRLLKKVSEHIGKLEANHITLLKEDIARISHFAMQNDREVALRLLFEMETRLKRHDLANELSVVYKLLARLHRFYPEYEYYEMQYKKYVAFSLAATKAEDLLYGFIYNLSHYYLNKQEVYKKSIESQLPELKSISVLYPSHRLFVVYTIAQIYYDCFFLSKEELALQEIEVEGKLMEFKKIFESYREDSFYQNIGQITPFLFFEFYTKIENNIKANFYLAQIKDALPYISHKQLWPFFITQMINAIVSKHITNANMRQIVETHKTLLQYYHPDSNEIPHYISYLRFSAIVYFYTGDYRLTAKTINTLRNTISLKNYIEIDTELKLFQAFQYALIDEHELSERLLSSAKRLVIDDEQLKPIVKLFGKVITLLIKHKKTGKEKDIIVRYWQKFKTANNKRILFFIRLSLLDI